MEKSRGKPNDSIEGQDGEKRKVYEQIGLEDKTHLCPSLQLDSIPRDQVYLVLIRGFESRTSMHRSVVFAILLSAH